MHKQRLIKLYKCKDLFKQKYKGDKMTFKLGADKGNSGALIRWGKHLDNGIWLRLWNFRKLWTKITIREGYIDLGLICIIYGN